MKIKLVKTISINLVAAIILMCLLLWGIIKFMDGYTHRGERIDVPDLRDLSVDEANILLKSNDLRYVIKDSSYADNKAPLAIISHNPKPGAKVKRNRIIYLIINASSPPMVKIPHLVDLSLRDALNKLNAIGLKSKLKTKFHPYENLVLELQYKGRKIDSNSMVTKGSLIEVVIGSGIGTEEKIVPDINGLTLQEGKNILNSNSLNIGGIRYDDGVEDKAEATIYKQVPVKGASLFIGEIVDVFLK